MCKTAITVKVTVKSKIPPFFCAAGNITGVTECLNLARTSWYCLVQHPAHCRVYQSRLPRTMSCQILNISTGGDSTASVGSLFQYLTTFTGRKHGVKIEFCIFHLMSIVCCPVSEQCLFFCPSHQVLTDTDELPCPEPSPLRLQSHNSLNLFSLEKCVTALILLTLCWTHSRRFLPLMLWETGVSTALQVRFHRCREERNLLFTRTLWCFIAKLLSCL